MATASKWTPFGVALDVTATGGSVTRTSATQFKVTINASWETYYSGASTNYGMDATSGGVTKTISSFGTSRSKGSGSFTGTYSISGNGAATKTITVTFKNYNTDNGKSATKSVSFSVSVPAWTSYTVKYNANGGTGAPSSQTKWKGQNLTLSSTKPTRTGYTFQGWATSASGAKAYNAGGTYSTDAAVTLYAVWKAITYTVSYNANGGTGAPSSQTKMYGTALTLSSTKPTKTNYAFKGWATSASSTTVAYVAGASYTANAAITLYAVWELAYVKPRITNFTVDRCDSAGNASDEGTYARVKFNWACDLTVITASVSWSSSEATDKGSATFSVSGTSGSVNEIVGSGKLSAETTYTIKVEVVDSNGSTPKTKTLNGQAFLVDCLPENKGIAFGKPAKLEDCADFKYTGLFRNHACTGDKTAYQDGKQGIFLSSEGFMHLQRTTAQGYHPYIAFYLDNATSAGGQIRLNATTKLMEFINASGYLFGSDVYLKNNEAIMGYDTSGAAYNAFQAKNESNNTIVGYGNYDNASGNTNIYGYDLNFGVANIATPGVYRPYRRRGDTLSLTIRTSGYVTNSGKDVSFFIPFSVPIVGSPTISVASGNGFILRQGTKYTHGSTASVYAKPSSYSADRHQWHGVTITAEFSDTTNVTNNDAIGIYWNGTITFS